MRKMQFSLREETQFFLLAVVVGAGLGMVYDVFRALRAIKKHNKVAVFVEDILFCLICGFSMYVFSTALTGKIRYFCVVGMAMGFVIEHFSVGNAVLFVVRKVSGGVKRKILFPFGKYITKSCRKIKGKFVKKYPNFQRIKKSDEKPLKVDF